MPAFSFKGQFVPYVEEGSKPHTIRNRRKYPVKVGDKLYLYYGLRTKWARRLREEVCTAVKSISIAENGIVLYSRLLTEEELEIARRAPSHSCLPIEDIMLENLADWLAWSDGFRPSGTSFNNPTGAFSMMRRFWKQTHSMPWTGDIIYWQPKKDKQPALKLIPVTECLPKRMEECLFKVAPEQGHDIARILSGYYTGHPESSSPQLAYEFSSPGSIWRASHWCPMPAFTIPD